MVSRKQLKDHAVDTVARQYQAGAFELTYEQAEREEAVDAATAAGISEEEIAVEACRKSLEK